MKEKNRARISVLQNLIITTLIILFFLGIVIVYYAMLNAETRDNIIKNGELNAVNAANRINSYLATGVDSIKLSGYTLDNMIRDKRSQEDILDFMIDQSFAMQNVVVGQVNGIYGYINGEYLDGALWVPEDDYVPTERPWYIAAMARSGKVVVVDPYIDAQTGSIMLTLAKTLCDAKSVVAIDIAIDQLQTTTEEIAAQGGSDMEIILSRSHQVIAHSDPKEVGKNYLQNDGTFGSAVVEKLREQSSDRRFFSVRFNGAEYSVYAITIENDWVCLSVTNATASFHQMQIPLILTIVVSMLIIVVFLFLMNRSNRRDALTKELKQLADQQTEYAYRDPMTGLKNRRAYSESIDRLSDSLPEDCCVIMFDVNGLKAVNDTYGHEAGDELITAAAQCLVAAFDGIDTIYRLGGDEFCVLLSGNAEQVQRRLERFDRLTAGWAGHYINSFSVSRGFGTAAGHSGIDELLKEADRKMYEYKSIFYRAAGHDRRKA